MGKMFWENAEQAGDRLSGTYVLYGDQAAYVEGVKTVSGKGACGLITLYGDDGPSPRDYIPLDDDKFHSFHKLPPLGYFNAISLGRPTCFYMKRIPERSRLHGLRNNRITLTTLSDSGVEYRVPMDFSMAVGDKGYRDRVRGIYPTAKEIFENLTEGTCAAFSPSYAIYKDSFGSCFLYRKLDRIGTVTSGEVYAAPSTMRMYREELEETGNFDLQIQERV